MTLMRIFKILVVVSLAAFSAAWSHPGHEADLETAAGALPESKVKIREQGNQRIIQANGIPDHATGQFPNRHNPNAIAKKNYTFRMTLAPKVAAKPTPTGYAWFGVALNGVPFEPGTQEFYQHDRSSAWTYEAIGGESNLGIDQSLAHVQPNGAYHYHGAPLGLIEKLGGDGQKMLMVGWAADGFPLYSTYGPSEATNPASPLRKMKSSYRLKTGERPKSAKDPGGPYDGNFTQDFEYVAGSGDLDECNGRFGVTPEFPEGIYHYYCTEDFPRVSRYWRGTGDPSFQKQGPPPGAGRPGGGTQASRVSGQDNQADRGSPVQRFDQNGDGKISMEEAPPPMQRNFSQHDSNGDGLIDTEEAKSLPRPGQGGPQGPPPN